MATLDDKLDRVLGKKTGAALEKAFGHKTVRDLLTHYPRRLDDRGELTDISTLTPGEHVTVLARVKSSTVATYRPKHGNRLAKRTTVTITDGHLDITATYFNQTWKAGALEPGVVAFFSGKVGSFRGHASAQPTDVRRSGQGGRRLGVRRRGATALLADLPGVGECLLEAAGRLRGAGACGARPGPRPSA